MTREQIEQLNEAEPYCFETSREEQWYNVGLQEGLKIADANPKSPWISVTKDLPCNHSKLINGSSTVEVFAACKDGYFSSTYMIKGLKEWVWFDFKPDYWMLPPRLPKR